MRTGRHLSDEDDVLAAELLLELAHEPRLDLLEGPELRHRDEDDDRLLALHVYLLPTGGAQMSSSM